MRSIRSLVLLGLVLGEVLSMAASPAYAVKRITEYPIPTPSSVPEDIAAGPDGNLWFTESTGNKIGRITPQGAITEYPIPTVFSNPVGIAAGPDGNVWFTEFNGDKIGPVVDRLPPPAKTGPVGSPWSPVRRSGRVLGRGTHLGFFACGARIPQIRTLSCVF